VFFRLAKLLAFVAVIQILGGHWMVLQSAAWVGMVIDFAQRESLPVAIEKTFDGGHPCNLCETVTKGRSLEQKTEAAKLVVKFEAVLSHQLVLAEPVGTRWEYPQIFRAQGARFFPPPTPPPLAA